MNKLAFLEGYFHKTAETKGAKIDDLQGQVDHMIKMTGAHKDPEALYELNRVRDDAYNKRRNKGVGRAYLHSLWAGPALGGAIAERQEEKVKRIETLKAQLAYLRSRQLQAQGAAV